MSSKSIGVRSRRFSIASTRAGFCDVARDQIRERAAEGKSVFRYNDPRASVFAERLRSLLAEAELDAPEGVHELKALVSERLRLSF
jgi:hypothetical protein